INFGYNFTFGGKNWTINEETRNKIKDAKRKEVNNKNYKNPFKGKHHTEETKKKLRKLAIERMNNEEYKNKIINSLKEYYKNHESPLKGKTFFTENQIKYINNKKEKINEYDIYGNYLKTYESI